VGEKFDPQIDGRNLNILGGTAEVVFKKLATWQALLLQVRGLDYSDRQSATVAE
jgi:hypothetical protein